MPPKLRGRQANKNRCLPKDSKSKKKLKTKRLDLSKSKQKVKKNLKLATNI